MRIVSLNAITKNITNTRWENSNNTHTPRKNEIATQREYDILLKSYNNLQKTHTDNLKILDDAQSRVINLQKEKDLLIKELGSKDEEILLLKRQNAELKHKLNDNEITLYQNTSMLTKSKSSKRMISVDRNVKELEKQLEMKNKEISSLQDKLQSSSPTPSNGSSIKKYESIINEMKKEILSLKEEADNVKEKEGKRYTKLINKYEHMLSLSENENKKLKMKVKELEMRISKIMLSK